jgi:hypothetical protein
VWIAVGALFLFFCGRETWRARFQDTAILVFISSLPAIGLIVRNRLSSGTSSDRSMHWHTIGTDHLHDALMTVSSWFLPWRWMGLATGLAITILCAVLVLVLIAVWRRRRLTEEASAKSLFFFGSSTLLFLAVYVAHLLLAISVVDYSTPLDGRILAPVTVSLICLMAVALALVRPGMLRVATLVAALLLVSVSVGRGAGWLLKNRKEQIGYLAPGWTNGKAARFVRELPATVAIYSNRPEQLYFSLHRPVRSIPFKSDPMTRVQNPQLEGEIQTMRNELEATHGVIVYFPPPRHDATYTANRDAEVPLSRLHEFTLGELEQRLHLERQLTEDLANIDRATP